MAAHTTARQIGAAEHRRAPLAKDARLLAADRFERVTQPVDMIDADRTDHGDVGVDDVGGVEPSAQPHFEHRHVDRRAAKQVERRERVVLEERERDVARAPRRCARRLR